MLAMLLAGMGMVNCGFKEQTDVISCTNYDQYSFSI